MMDNSGMSQGAKCPCPHHKVVPLFITVIGLVFLLGAFNIVSARFVEVTWPIMLMLIGLQKMFNHMCKCCSSNH